jgi:hypothetical protein
MAISLVQSKAGVSASATTNPSIDSAPTSGNLIVLCFASDDYNGTPDSGWTESTNMEQQAWHGAYIWWRISNGSNPPGSYTIGSATVSGWVMMEFSGCDTEPYDISDSQQSVDPGTTYTTPSITPTSGDRLLVALLAGDQYESTVSTSSGWTNSFNRVDDAQTTAGATDDIASVAYRIVTANGATGYSTGATWTNQQLQRTGHIIAFKASSGEPPPGTQKIYASADDTDGGWTDQAGGTTLYAAIDETSASDADYIRSADSPSSDTCKVHLGDPGVSVTTPINLRVRYAKVGTGTINLTVKLFEGSTELWSKAYNNISASLTTATESDITLNQPISDETNLYVSFIATAV